MGNNEAVTDVKISWAALTPLAPRSPPPLQSPPRPWHFHNCLPASFLCISLPTFFFSFLASINIYSVITMCKARCRPWGPRSEYETWALKKQPTSYQGSSKQGMPMRPEGGDGFRKGHVGYLLIL